MAFSDSMFLFEIVVEELISYINCSDFDIRGHFADVFSVHLPDPLKTECFMPKQPGKRARKLRIKPKSKTRISSKLLSDNLSSMAPNVQSGQTILFAINVDTLFSNMKKYPLEISFWSKVVPDYRIGSTSIPWSSQYFGYLSKLHKRRELQPLSIIGDYNVFDEITSKRMAVIKLNVKLRHYKDRITKFSSFSSESQRTSTMTSSIINSAPVSVDTTISKPSALTEDTGLIKTKYIAEKRSIPSKKRNIKKEENKSVNDISSQELARAEADNKIYKRTLTNDDLFKQRIASPDADNKIYKRRLNTDDLSNQKLAGTEADNKVCKRRLHNDDILKQRIASPDAYNKIYKRRSNTGHLSNQRLASSEADNKICKRCLKNDDLFKRRKASSDADNKIYKRRSNTGDLSIQRLASPEADNKIYKRRSNTGDLSIQRLASPEADNKIRKRRLNTGDLSNQKLASAEADNKICKQSLNNDDIFKRRIASPDADNKIYKRRLNTENLSNQRLTSPEADNKICIRTLNTDDLSKSNQELTSADAENKTYKRILNTGIISLVRSDIKLDKSLTTATITSKSCSTIDHRNYNILNEYIFGGAPEGPFGNQVYFVNYFTVENDFAESSPSPKTPSSPKTPVSPKSPDSPKSPGSPGSPKSPGPKSPGSAKSPDSSKTPGSPKFVSEKTAETTASEKSKSVKSDPKQEKARYKFRICESECPFRKIKGPKLIDTQSVCSLDLPEKASSLILVKKCDDVKCTYEKMREVPTPPDDRIMLHMSSRSGAECCQKVTEKVEEQVITGMKAKMKFGSEPCYCECECQFRFMKKTTFCKICGGYERFGEDYGKQPGYDLPFPCPIFHKLADKIKLKMSTSGSDTKKKKDSKVEDKTESDKELTKKGKKHKDERFKFNYGYTAPHIGHSRCALPCVGTLGAVPKRMGWLWNCENVPGMKYRPQWKPGASNKHVVRLLKMAKNPGDFLAKKRKKEKGKPKRPLKRPLLTVLKKDGEFTVTMETMKTFTKPRALNQYPYEDKPLVTYTIGRTSEENLERKIRKDRARRRLERLQRDFVQSAFRDMCKEICMKTYQQALGLLPNAEEPDCSCFPAIPASDDVDMDHSCSCSEDKELSESDTDSDEWMIEFTPPTARFDPTYKVKKLVTVDGSTQYSYLDYRVKLLDRLGNPVPRFFKGPDGKQQCSDLGGFWDPDHNWLEINVDGFIGPDERWAPNNFLGPNNEMVDGESGKFQAMDGKWLVIGVDGYVEHGKWKFYANTKSKSAIAKKKRTWRKTGGGGVGTKEENRSEATWSCFGSATPKQLSKMGIVGHGYDKKLLNKRLKELLKQGKDIKIPQPTTVPRSGRSRGKRDTPRSFVEKTQCKHPSPSDKGIIAVDGRGNKTYFRLKDYDNRRPKDRIVTLTDQGISVSSFHVPCFSSFISSEMMKKQQYDRLVAMAERRQEQGQGASQDSKGGRTTNASTPVADYRGV